MSPLSVFFFVLPVLQRIYHSFSNSSALRPVRLQGDQSSPNALDSFYVLGDNSPQSHDGRRWTLAAPTLRLTEGGKPVYQLGTVPRYNMIGKAVFVYWPSGFRLPGMAILPIVPNVGSMRAVR